MTIEIISERQTVLDAPNKWKELHLLPTGWRGAAKKAAYDRIMALDLNTATIRDVNNAVQPGWEWIPPIPVCNNCGAFPSTIARLYFNSRNVHLCLKCLKKATRKLKKADKGLPVFTPIPLPPPKYVDPQEDGGTTFMKWRGLVEIQRTTDTFEVMDILIGQQSVIESIEMAHHADTFKGSATVAIAGEKFSVDNVWGYGWHGDYSEYTPGNPAELMAGPHNLIDILERYEGQNITMWVANGPFNLIE